MSTTEINTPQEPKVSVEERRKNRISYIRANIDYLKLEKQFSEINRDISVAQFEELEARAKFLQLNAALNGKDEQPEEIGASQTATGESEAKLAAV